MGRNAEWGTRHAAREQVASSERNQVTTPDHNAKIVLDDVPVRPVQPQRLARVIIGLDAGEMLKPSRFKPASLPSGARADFYGRESAEAMHAP